MKKLEIKQRNSGSVWSVALITIAAFVFLLLVSALISSADAAHLFL